MVREGQHPQPSILNPPNPHRSLSPPAAPVAAPPLAPRPRRDPRAGGGESRAGKRGSKGNANEVESAHQAYTEWAVGLKSEREA